MKTRGLTYGYILVGLYAYPYVSSAQSLLSTCQGDECRFQDLITVIEGVMKYALIIAIPISAIVFAVAGFKIVTARDNAGARTEAKKMMGKVAAGLIIMLAAGLIVNTVISGLGVGDDYKLIEEKP